MKTKQASNVVVQAGKRYTFHTHTEGHSGLPLSFSREVSALFTGEYDQDNGNAILMDKQGTRWSVPAKDLKSE